MISWLFGWLIFGTIAYWIVAGVSAFLLFTMVDDEEPAPAGITAIVGLVISSMVISTIRIFHLPWYYWIGGVIAYLLVGGIWSLVKWRSYTSAKVEDFNKKAKANNWVRGVTTSYNYALEDLKTMVMPSENKNRIYTWIAFWPWSIIITSLGDVFRGIFKAFSQCYDKITSSALREIQ